MALRGHSAFVLAFLLAAAPLAAQENQSDRIQQLEKRIDELAQQAATLRREVDALKASQPAATEAATTPAPADEDLTRIDVPAATTEPTAATATGAQATTTPDTRPVGAPAALTDVETVSNQSNPGLSKVFNPDTSVIGTFIGKAGRPNPFEYGGDSQRPPMQLDEAELAFEAFVDPYAKAKFFLSASPEGLSIEEAFAQFVTLPYDLTAKAGRMKALFGKANTWHTHARPWVDQPLVIHNFFGDEQLADSGISASRVFPNDFAFVEATGEVFRGQVQNVFGRAGENRVAWNTHLKAYKDLTENSNVELGTSYARGTLPDSAGTRGANQFGGIDLTYRWKPLSRGLYRSLIARFEGVIDDRADLIGRLGGFYTSVDYQLAQRWFTGLRLDSADRVLMTNALASGSSRDRGVSATLTFWPSEFSQLRGQLRRTEYGDVRRTVNELLFQLQFAIGAHGAHTF